MRDFKTILIVDDSKVDRNILKGIFSSSYNILEAENGAEAIDILDNNYEAISLVLLDLSMPVLNGFDTLAKIRHSNNYAHIPVIIGTADGTSISEMYTLNFDVDDYIVKPYNVAVIKKRVERVIRFSEVSTTVKLLQRDKLTKLYNREIFLEKALTLIESHEEAYYNISCLNIENFKVINDKYGLQVGDEILIHIASCLKEFIIKYEGLCCRINDDIFAVLYPVSLVNDLILKEEYKELSNPKCVNFTISLRIGRYLVTDKSLSVSAMVDRAKLAENTIKGKYDTYISNFDETMRDNLIRRQEIIAKMDQALNEGQFEMWLQPQINYNDKTLIGAEALVRWNDPNIGIIPPNDFIPLFEENGFIYEIDKFMWEEACKTIRNWINLGIDPIPISVNVSRIDIFKDDFIMSLTRILEKYNVNISYLRLEITESAFSFSTNKIIDIVKELMNLGFIIEIDDFGSGYSSLNTLKDVPVDILKLDMRFLEDSKSSRRGGNILESVCRMAKWLGMSVIAEGVETVEQAEFLHTIGCNYIQGYLYSKPLPLESFQEFYKNAKFKKDVGFLNDSININNNTFWDPKSTDTLIFNGYVGAASIIEYCNEKIELLRANDKYVEEFNKSFSINITASELNPFNYMNSNNVQVLTTAIQKAITTSDEVSCDIMLEGNNSKNIRTKVYFRAVLKCIARVDERYLLYCGINNITEEKKREEELLKSEEEYRLAAYLSRNVIGRYDIKTSTVTLTKEIAKKYSLPEVIEEVPYGRVKIGKISPDTASSYIELFEKIRKGEKEGTATYQKMLNGSFRWITAHFATMFSSDNTPVGAVISYRDVTEENEKEIIYARWRQSLSGKPLSSFTTFCCDLQKNNAYESRQGELLKADFNNKDFISFDMCTLIYANEYVYEEDRKEYIETLKTSKLKSDFTSSKYIQSFEYREIIDKNQFRWIKRTIELIPRNDNKGMLIYLMYEDIDEKKKEELNIQRLAESDPLTGLLNRNAFSEKMMNYIKTRKKKSLSAMFLLDLDRFKLINDTFGHGIGDKTLIDVAHAIKRVVRNTDFVCRLGGDEFLVFILDFTSKKEIEEKAKQICSSVHKSLSVDMILSTSLGISVCPCDGVDFAMLYHKADEALYKVKKSGKNNYAFYNEEF